MGEDKDMSWCLNIVPLAILMNLGAEGRGPADRPAPPLVIVAFW